MRKGGFCTPQAYVSLLPSQYARYRSAKISEIRINACRIILNIPKNSALIPYHP
ncbi:MAG: hypothetical protein QXS79_01930 [Candidatus Bathyarchaeia archaeon]